MRNFTFSRIILIYFVCRMYNIRISFLETYLAYLRSTSCLNCSEVFSPFETFINSSTNALLKCILSIAIVAATFLISLADFVFLIIINHLFIVASGIYHYILANHKNYKCPIKLAILLVIIPRLFLISPRSVIIFSV